MTKITRIDRSTLKYIDQRLMEAIADLGDELGLSIKVGSGSYSSTSYTPKLEIKLLDQATGVAVVDPFFKLKCDQHGLDPTMISREGYRLSGYNPRAPRFPWLMEDTRNGQQRKATDGWVKSRFAKLNPAVPPRGVIPTNTNPHTSPTTPAPSSPSPGRTYEPSF